MTLSISSPLTGWVMPLDDVPDPVFAARMLGEGVAIEPTDGRVVAPAAGIVATLNPSAHAVTLDLDDGQQLLIHVGIDTVALAGAGFRAHVSQGQRVVAGELLISFDLDHLARNARSLATPVIVTSGGTVGASPGRLVEAGAHLFDVGAGSAAASSPGGAPTVQRSLRLPLKHGLHARPSARIAALAHDFEAAVTLRTRAGKSASALSPIAMLALTLPHGAELTIEAAGPAARAAVDAIAELIEGGMGELEPVIEAGEEPVEAPSTDAPHPPLAGTVPGITAAPGFAIGPSHALRPAATLHVEERGRGPEVERAALAEARATVRQRLAPGASDTGVAAEVVRAHLAFLDDPALGDAAEQGIVGGQSAGRAWQRAVAQFATALRGAGERFAERVDDLRDLERQVLSALAGESEADLPPPGAILVARELLPSELVALAPAGLAGICTAQGGATSHVAIIAAAMGIPMLTAIGPGIEALSNGTPLILDGRAGRLVIAPSPAERQSAEKAQEKLAWRRSVAGARAHDPAVTLDGRRIEVFANLGSHGDAVAAVAAGAEGCGLLRTEFLFLDRPDAPDEAEQRRTYQDIADALGGRPLIVRTLDIGADKPAPYLPMPTEENPALGVRGLRLGLARPELLTTQLRALVTLNATDVKIMLPMVSSLEELQETRTLLFRIAEEAGRTPPPLGIMIETPAAAMVADTLAKDAAFFSIGSNDLSQYTLAMDRGNAGVAAGLDALHPAVLRLIRATVEGGRKAMRWTGVCGGVAADPVAVPILIGLGVTELSVPPAAVAEVKHVVRLTMAGSAAELAERACGAPTAAAVRAIARNYLEQAE